MTRDRITYRVDIADRSKEPGVWVGQERHRNRPDADGRALFWAKERGEARVVQEGGRRNGDVLVRYYQAPGGMGSSR